MSESFPRRQDGVARAADVDPMQFVPRLAGTTTAGRPTVPTPSSVSVRVNAWLAGPRGSVARRIRRAQIVGQDEIAGLAAFLCGVMESDRVPLISFVPTLRPTSAFFMALASELNWVLARSFRYLVVAPSRLRHPQQWLTAARVRQQLNAASDAIAVTPRGLPVALTPDQPQLVLTQDQWLPLLDQTTRGRCQVVRFGSPGSSVAASAPHDTDCWIAVEAY